MSIQLTATQEQFIRAKLQTGRYRSAEELLEIALHLLDEYEQADAEWVEEVRVKVEAAVAASSHTPPLDGEMVVNQILDRFRSAK